MATAGAALGGVAATATVAQSPGAKRIGWLTPFSSDDPVQLANRKVYEDAFRARGWELGRSLVYLERRGPRDAKGWEDATRELAAEADLIITVFDVQTAAALRVERAKPVVGLSGAPIELGFAQSLARPGGNFTGVSFQAQDETGRVLSLLRDIRPGLTRVGVPLLNTNRVSNAWFGSFVEAARGSAISIVPLPVPAGPAELASMLDAAKAERIQALVLAVLPWLNKAVWQQITDWAIAQRVVTRGSLVSRGDAVVAFGANLPALLRLHVDQIDRVLRGANPAELPIQQPTVWDTVINQKLARAVGWPAPGAVLLQATEVIE